MCTYRRFKRAPSLHRKYWFCFIRGCFMVMLWCLTGGLDVVVGHIYSFPACRFKILVVYRACVISQTAVTMEWTTSCVKVRLSWFTTWGHREYGGIAPFLLNIDLDGNSVTRFIPFPLYSRGKSPVPLEYEDVWVSEAFWTFCRLPVIEPLSLGRLSHSWSLCFIVCGSGTIWFEFCQFFSEPSLPSIQGYWDNPSRTANLPMHGVVTPLPHTPLRRTGTVLLSFPQLLSK